MKKNFLSHLIFLIFLNLLIKPFWILGIDRSVQNELGPAEYGLYFSLFNFSYLFQVILDFGINNHNNRLIAQDPSRIEQYFTTTFIAKILFSIFYTAIVFMCAFGIQFTGHQLEILGLLILNQIFLSLLVFIRSNVSGLHLFKSDAVLSVLDKSISSVLCALILWTNITPFTITINNFIWMQIIGYIITCGVGLLMLGGYLKSIRFRFRFELLKEIIRSSYPFAMLSFLMVVYYRIDGVMIERILGENGAKEAGIYASAFRLLDALSILGLTFASLLLPMFSRMLHQKEPVQQFSELNFKIMLLLSAGSGIVFIFYRQPIMDLLYINSTPYYGVIFGWLMVSFINISMVYIFGTLLTANGSLKTLNHIALTGVILNITLNLILIPQMQAEGAAIATVVTQIFVTTAHIVATYRIMQFKFIPKVWWQAAGFIILFIFLCFGITYLRIHWYYNLLISMLLSLPVALSTGLLRYNELAPVIRILKKK